MPQPYQGLWSADIDSLSKRPELAMHIGIIIGMWANVDLAMARLLSEMLHISASRGTAMYVAIENDGARKASMRAAAKECLPEDLQKEFESLLVSLKTPAAQRNKMAHGIWGIPRDDIPILVWSDSRAAAKFSASLTYSSAIGLQNLKAHDWKGVEATMVEYQSGALSYGEKDFEAIEANVKRAILRIYIFIQKVRESRGSLASQGVH